MVHSKRHLIFLCLVFMGLLSCSNNNEDNSESADISPAPGASVKTQCYQCTQKLSEGDECGESLVSGLASRFDVSVDSSKKAEVVINKNQMILSGTLADGKLNVSDDFRGVKGPGLCDMEFSKLNITGQLSSIGAVATGWAGIFSYDLFVDKEDECDQFPFTTCHAVHAVTCTPGC